MEDDICCASLPSNEPIIAATSTELGCVGDCSQPDLGGFAIVTTGLQQGPTEGNGEVNNVHVRQMEKLFLSRLRVFGGAPSRRQHRATAVDPWVRRRLMRD